MKLSLEGLQFSVYSELWLEEMGQLDNMVLFQKSVRSNLLSAMETVRLNN